jgi:anion-transporting  ArsA/GET3 family ATPase
MTSVLANALDGASVVLCCGAGGVGKTTTAAALGLAAALAGRGRVLVLTIDPARRLADALGLEAFGNVERRVDALGVPAGSELWVAMLDTSASWDDLVRQHAPDAATVDRILGNQLYRNITERFVQSHDYIAMERLHAINASGQYDLIVIDTPPSRNALDFLDSPTRMADFFSSTLLKWITLPYRLGGERAGRLGYLAAKPFYQVADRILGSQFLKDIAEFFLLFQTMYDGFVARATEVETLLHQRTTRFIVVSSLEPAPLQEAEFFLAELRRRRLAVGALVVNRVLPSYLFDASARRLASTMASSTSLARSRDGRVQRRAAAAFLDLAAVADSERAARDRLANPPECVVEVPLLATDLHNLQGILAIAAVLWPTSGRAPGSGAVPRRGRAKRGPM